MEDSLFIKEGVTIPAGELRFATNRAGGPGGQHVNKTNSRVSIFWDLAGTTAVGPHLRARLMRRLQTRLTRDGHIVVHVDENRSQHQNRQTALERLARIVLDALAVRKKRVPTRMSASQKRRRLDEKRRRSNKKRLRRDPTDY